ncbi:MAG TPA: radical SAM protein [bacterium]|nr:radical SAM protein [bacterium]HQL62477.1 radical SAM protein [bacterium]
MSQYVFGPVPSRRLGRSLGIDLLPLKTCSFNCVYCQVGRTTCLAIERKEWVPTAPVLEQVKQRIAGPVSPDVITFSGSGEPTLHSGIGEIIRGIKSFTQIPVVVLTNGSLLWMPEVRRDLLEADIVVPSLDAGSESLFQYVNRPHPDISLEKLIEGTIRFREEYKGQIWLEVFLMWGVTAMDREVEKMAAIAERIRPDRIQLNTVARPPAEEYAYSVPEERMRYFATMFEPKAEVIGGHSSTLEMTGLVGSSEEILALVRRRPCTLDDIADGLAMNRNVVIKYVDRLISEGHLRHKVQDSLVYYWATEESPSKNET